MILRADDDGVVEAYPLMKLLGSPNDSFKVLLLKGFVKQLNEDQVVVIMDWLEHNMIRADRKVDSIYKELLLENAPEIKLIEPKPRSDVEDNSRRIADNGRTMDSPRSAQVRLGKVRSSQDKVSQVNTYSSKTPSDLDENFIRFWERYPRKVAKPKAEQAWRKLKPSQELADQIISNVESMRSCSQWTRDNGQFIPHPTTYLNQQRWNDQLDDSINQSNIIDLGAIPE